MFAALVQKYGPEPAEDELVDKSNSVIAAESYAALQVKYNQLAEEHQNVLEKLKSIESNTFDQIQKPHHPVTIHQIDYLPRLQRFYRRYNKEKLSECPKILDSFVGSEEKLFAALVQKYGPEPQLPIIGPHGLPKVPPKR